jgi:ribosome-binding factor A
MQKKSNPNRAAKASAVIQQALGPILKDLLENRPGMVTVSKVETTKDLRWAKVWISVFNDDEQAVLKEIEKNIYRIQGEVNKEFATKIIPRLQFFLDKSPAYAQHIDELIRKIHDEE